METRRFQSFGGWDLHQTEDVYEAARDAAATVLGSFHERARVVEVRIEVPSWCERIRIEYVTGYTFANSLPPHGKPVQDGDCTITVLHYLDIRQGKA